MSLSSMTRKAPIIHERRDELMSGRVFESMSSQKMAGLIRTAQRRVVLAVPGVQDIES